MKRVEPGQDGLLRYLAGTGGVAAGSTATHMRCGCLWSEESAERDEGRGKKRVGRRWQQHHGDGDGRCARPQRRSAAGMREAGAWRRSRACATRDALGPHQLRHHQPISPRIPLLASACRFRKCASTKALHSGPASCVSALPPTERKAACNASNTPGERLRYLRRRPGGQTLRQRDAFYYMSRHVPDL